MLALPPVAALVTGFFAVAIPTILLMAVWSAVTVCRLLFPEKPLPFDSHARRWAAGQKGHAVRVGLRDIMEDQRRFPARPVMPWSTEVAVDSQGEEIDALQRDLWRRRN